MIVWLIGNYYAKFLLLKATIVFQTLAKLTCKCGGFAGLSEALNNHSIGVHTKRFICGIYKAFTKD